MEATTSVTAEVERFVDDMIRAHRGLRWDEWLGNYAEPEAVWVANDGVLYPSGDKYAEHYRTIVSSVAKVEDFELLRRRVYELGPNDAVLVAEYRQRMRLGESAQDFKGAWTVLVKRSARGWEIVHEHSSHVR